MTTPAVGVTDQGLNPAQAGMPTPAVVDLPQNNVDPAEQTPSQQPEPQAAPDAPLAIGDQPNANEATPDASADGDEFVYDPTGDTSLDVALGFIGRMGIGPDSAEVRAAMGGDFALLSAKLATMGDKATGWEQMVALAKDAYTRAESKATENVAKCTAAALSVVGGQENWNTIHAWAEANADPDEKAEINAMLKASPVQARAAAALLAGAYGRATGTSVKPASAIKQDATGSPAQSFEPLTQREFADKVRELSNRVGPINLHSHPEYAALASRLRR